MPQDLYAGGNFNPLSVLDEYDFERLGKDDPLGVSDADLDFDKYFMSDYLATNVSGLEDDATAAAGGSS